MPKNESRLPTTRGIKKPLATKEKIFTVAKNFFKQFGTAMLAVAVVAYMFLQLMLNVGTLIDTAVADYVNITDNLELEAFLFRDETPISSGEGGTDCFLARDGEKVKLGQQIAITYSDPKDADTQARINEIDARISVLEQSSLGTGASTTSITIIDEEISSLVLEIVRQSDKNEFDKILRKKEELLILMNRRQALTQAHSYAVEMAELSREREALTASLSGASFVTRAPMSGYFYANVDGYEEIFTLDRLKTLTGEDFDSLKDSVADQALIDNSSGKIIETSTWYIAVSVDKRTAESYRDGATVPITFQYSNNKELKMKLERRVNRTDVDSTVLIFSTKDIPESFDFSRCQTVELPRKDYEGIRVPTSAIRMQDGVTGVYVVVGTKVVFKKADVIYNYGGYSVCSIPKNPAYPNRRDIAYFSGERLSLHDAVIVGGSDIYDGMRLK